MTSIRRRLLRSATPSTNLRASRRQERVQRELAKSREALRRWMSRLKRAIRTVDRLQRRIARYERQPTPSA